MPNTTKLCVFFYNVVIGPDQSKDNIFFFCFLAVIFGANIKEQGKEADQKSIWKNLGVELTSTRNSSHHVADEHKYEHQVGALSLS